MIKILNILKRDFETIYKKIKWRSNNRHNSTRFGDIRDINCVKVGKGTYGVINAELTASDAKLILGNYCSIAKGVRFIPCADHCLNLLSTYPYKTMLLNMNNDAITKGDIVIEDDVWIGYGATILSGVQIGQGAVIAAGAVVNKDVEPYSIVGGVPARIIRYRFNPEIINYLRMFDYGSLTEQLVKDHIDDLYKPIERMTFKEIRTLYAWFPKKRW